MFVSAKNRGNIYIFFFNFISHHQFARSLSLAKFSNLPRTLISFFQQKFQHSPNTNIYIYIDCIHICNCQSRPLISKNQPDQPPATPRNPTERKRRFSLDVWHRKRSFRVRGDWLRSVWPRMAATTAFTPSSQKIPSCAPTPMSLSTLLTSKNNLAFFLQ